MCGGPKTNQLYCSYTSVSYVKCYGLRYSKGTTKPRLGDERRLYGIVQYLDQGRLLLRAREEGESVYVKRMKWVLLRRKGCDICLLLRYGYMTASFPLVYRWGKDVHCIVPGRRSWESDHTYDLVISCKGRAVSSVVKTEPQRSLASLLCEINHASLTNKCLIAPAVCTVPNPSPRPSAFHDFSTSTTRHPGDQVTSIHTHIISSTDFSIMLGVARREILNPDTVQKA